MFRQMLRAKIHRATVTEACLEYEGSLTVEEDLLDAAGILPYEAIVCSNLNNGERFMTYAMKGKRGRGEIVLNALPGHEGTWNEAGCDRQLVKRGDRWAVVPLQGE